MHDSTLGGDPGEFTVAKHLGLSGEAHLALHGIPRSRREALMILKNFDSENVSEPEEVIIEEIIEDGNSDEDETSGTQFSLDSF